MATDLRSVANEKVLGHPSGLFLLFFTEMWERFSYYGMRALLTLFLVSAMGIGGWEWTPAEALTLYGIYTGLVYITPIFGGLIADKITGFRMAILLGAFLMTAGHASMAFETEASFYLGLGLIILGNGLFKPNISSIVGSLYKKNPERKDAAYTIFYMGINAGAFMGIMLCGYIGEKVGWSYGFGLAGVFMFLGMLMFQFGQKLFGDIGTKPKSRKHKLNDPVEIMDEEADTSEAEPEDPKVRKDRLMVIGILSIFTIFFWMAFEQAGGSMTLFAKSFTDRILEGSAASAFVVVDTIITIVPLAVITYVLFLLIKATYKRIALSNIFIGLSFLIIWGIAIWKVIKDANTVAYEVEFMAENGNAPYKAIPAGVESDTLDFTAEAGLELNSTVYLIMDEETEGYVVAEDDDKDEEGVIKATAVSQEKSISSIRTDKPLETGQQIPILDIDQQGSYRYLDEETAKKVDQKEAATVISKMDNAIEIPASWFGVLNSLFIILFAPLFSKIWESRFNPSAPIKFAIGLILLGLGFGVLAIGAAPIETGAKSAEVSLIWLVLAYLMHTLGELSLSPVGLSYVSKLSPQRLVGLMFGVWFGATALANYIAGWTGSYIEKISESVGLSGFFLIYTAIPIGAGLVLIMMNKYLLKKMHGIR